MILVEGNCLLNSIISYALHNPHFIYKRNVDPIVTATDNAAANTSDKTKPAQSFVEADPEAFSLDSGARLVRDERGVRLAREEESD